jgi:hypothetical protein
MIIVNSLSLGGGLGGVYKGWEELGGVLGGVYIIKFDLLSLIDPI